MWVVKRERGYGSLFIVADFGVHAVPLHMWGAHTHIGTIQHWACVTLSLAHASHTSTNPVVRSVCHARCTWCAHVNVFHKFMSLTYEFYFLCSLLLALIFIILNDFAKNISFSSGLRFDLLCLKILILEKYYNFHFDDFI